MRKPRISLKSVITVVIVVLLALIGVLLNTEKENMRIAINETTVKEMTQIGTQLELLLENALEDSSDDLQVMVEYIIKHDINKTNIKEFLQTQAQTESFDSLYYIDLEGVGISNADTIRSFENNDSYLYTMEQGVNDPSPFISISDQAFAFYISLPIIRDEKLEAVLLCEVTMDSFLQSITESVGSSSDMFLVDHSLNLIFSTSEGHVGRDTIPEGDRDEIGIENILQAHENFLADTSGAFYYDYYGIPKVMVYFPIQGTDWALAMNVEIDSFSGLLMEALDSFEGATDVIYWGVVLLVGIIALTQFVSQKQLVRIAYYDTLTGLPNMAKLKEEVTKALSNGKNKSYTIIVFDIENFKAINEIFGYEVGDRVLKSVKSFGESLKEPSLVTARISGDRFAMFAESELFQDFSIFLSTVDSHFDKHVPELKDYTGTFKVGRYCIESGMNDFDKIMANVHLAHGKAKHIMGEFLCDYNETLKNKLLQDADISGKMKLALENQEFQVYLQPKFCVESSKLIGAEALVRWKEKAGNMIFPDAFIPLFERNGFIVELDQYILDKVSMTMKAWIDRGWNPITISVNCSRLNLDDPHFVEKVIKTVDKHQLPHECIEIELTESTTITNEATIEQIFADLRQNGFKISIDDFGAGYSSLGMLKNLQVDTLKMDRSFFVSGKNAKRDDMLIDSIIQMSHNLGMYVVAEGIETQEQVNLLRAMGCDAIQGYVYAKPMPMNEFEERYEACLQI